MRIDHTQLAVDWMCVHSMTDNYINTVDNVGFNTTFSNMSVTVYSEVEETREKQSQVKGKLYPVKPARYGN